MPTTVCSWLGRGKSPNLWTQSSRLTKTELFDPLAVPFFVTAPKKPRSGATKRPCCAHCAERRLALRKRCYLEKKILETPMIGISPKTPLSGLSEVCKQRVKDAKEMQKAIGKPTMVEEDGDFMEDLRMFVVRWATEHPDQVVEEKKRSQPIRAAKASGIDSQITKNLKVVLRTHAEDIRRQPAESASLTHLRENYLEYLLGTGILVADAIEIRSRVVYSLGTGRILGLWDQPETSALIPDKTKGSDGAGTRTLANSAYVIMYQSLFSSINVPLYAFGSLNEDGADAVFERIMKARKELQDAGLHIRGVLYDHHSTQVKCTDMIKEMNDFYSGVEDQQLVCIGDPIHLFRCTQADLNTEHAAMLYQDLRVSSFTKLLTRNICGLTIFLY